LVFDPEEGRDAKRQQNLVHLLSHLEDEELQFEFVLEVAACKLVPPTLNFCFIESNKQTGLPLDFSDDRFDVVHAFIEAFDVIAFLNRNQGVNGGFLFLCAAGRIWEVIRLSFIQEELVNLGLVKSRAPNLAIRLFLHGRLLLLFSVASFFLREALRMRSQLV